MQELVDKWPDFPTRLIRVEINIVRDGSPWLGRYAYHFEDGSVMRPDPTKRAPATGKGMDPFVLQVVANARKYEQIYEQIVQSMGGEAKLAEYRKELEANPPPTREQGSQ